jgi:glucokinase
VYIGADIGGTTGRVSAFGGLGDTTEIDRVEFPVTQSPNGDFAQDLNNLMLACGRLAARNGRVEGIGLAIAGKVDAARTMLTAAGNLGHWAGKPVVAMLAERLGLDCPVVLGNDAEAAAMAEALYGEGQEADFWFFIWGTGIGGCLVRYINGVAVPFAGELGHQQVNPWDDLLCGCGQKGCLEAYCGGAGIKKRLGIDPQNLTRDQWIEVVGWMSIGVRNVVAAQPVPLVVFGGGVANKQSALLKDLRMLLEADLRIVDVPDVRLSAFGESAGTIGALALVKVG